MPRMRMFLSILTALLLFAGGHTAAAGDATPSFGTAGRGNSPDARTLYLKVGEIDTRQLPSLLTLDAEFAPDKRYVIQLAGPITPQQSRLIEDAGVLLGEYLPMHAYIVRLDTANVAALASLEFVAWVGEYRNEWKISPGIGQRILKSGSRRDLAAAGRRVLVVERFRDARPLSRLAPAQLSTAGITQQQVHRASRSLTVRATEAQIPALAALDDVMFIEEAGEATPRNVSTSWIMQSYVENSRPLTDAGLNGEDQIVGIIDWDLDANHCAFDDDEHEIGPDHRKILAYYGAGVNPIYGYHGTHVAGVLAGDELALTNPALQGMAPKARMVFQHYEGILDENFALHVKERLEIAHEHGARIHNNSWGDYSTTYGEWARDIDEFTWENEEDLVLVAVINNGSVRSPENSKNCLAVASARDQTTNPSHTPEFRCNGGYGPTADGRQKPEVYGVGCGSQSAADGTACGNDDTGYGGGTSYATPAVSGMAVLARQYFMEGFYPSGVSNPADAFIPTGALLKALIANSAVDMTGMEGYFTSQEGWGRVLMDDVLYFAGDQKRTLLKDVRNAEGLLTGESDTYFVAVGPATWPLKITLVWTDRPAALAASFTPVNNLDLVVTAPDGLVYLGNQFDQVESKSGGTADIVNNIEQVHRQTVTPGVWRIEVQGTAVNDGPQGYALVVNRPLEVWPTQLETRPLGDINSDGQINGDDIGPFVSALAGRASVRESLAADMDGSHGLTMQDVRLFVDALLNAPEPSGRTIHGSSQAN